jgi:outer membrane protein OmpA-like peptidoglycan-associated protein
MTHESALDRRQAFVQRRSLTPSAVARKEIESQPSGANALRQRVGNQGIQTLLSAHSIQAKLTINQPGDAREQEADRVADAVMRMPAPVQSMQDTSPVSKAMSIPTVQRMCAECDDELAKKTSPGKQTMNAKEAQIQRKKGAAPAPQVTPSVAANIQTMRGGGNSLPAATRAFFEPRFGADFSHVRVHTGSRAEEAAKSIGAKAFTLGRDIGFNRGQYAPESNKGRRLLAHELTHVVQQNGSRLQRAESRTASSEVSNIIQRAGDPAKIPPGFRCPTNLTPGRPAGTDLRFTLGGTVITAAHTTQLTAFRATWLAAGGTDDILVHGYASTKGEQGPNWALSCDRAEAVRAELVRLGIPAVRINVVAHGESTDFGAGLGPNQHAVVSTSAGVLPIPLAGGVVTARDNFAGRSTTRFGVGEIIDLHFLSLPPRPAADFGGLAWHLAAGAGTLTPPNNIGTATYTAPTTAGAVRLELRVAAGATAGRVVSAHAIAIVIPTRVNMTLIPGTAPDFAGVIAAGTWGAGFHANVFVDPKDVSFQGVQFGEGTVAAVVTPAGSFLAARAGLVHPTNTFGFGHLGNATTGTPVSPPHDNIATAGGVTPRQILGKSICGASDFLWAIPWEFSVAGGARTPFAGGFTANHHVTSTLLCDATIEKGGAGPFKRPI